ncbi:antibiotic biosynthesis monooxygenase [Aquihabitans sp. G128]|uniref:putative quinol monooxygenase n=1 Tax=Aquihabitans sp. G128 TaxID=2849779 RepID=UPI001C21C422|nr:putative quinol monooxygenase [Aquihabitans sp. G128]QXC62167.1 antibiotic biosynthesis monooxygenase [Aquihabitans sp. G128]
MIVVAGHLAVNPEHRDAALAAIATGVAATRAEPGCVDYRFSPDLEDENRFNLIEQWESEEAMNEHLATPHLAEFMTAIVPCLLGAEIIRHDVSSSAPLF